jgi:hypothetical protein
MTEQRLVVDVKDVVLRLQCTCGAAVSVVPAKMKRSVFQCANCVEPWPGAVGEDRQPQTPVQRLAVALRDLQNETAEAAKGNEGTPRYHVQFEVKRP